MTVARTYAATLVGVAGYPVEIEADLSSGLPGLTFTGLPDTTVVEARDRVRAAILNSGADWPNRRITLALLPADLRKFGSRFDLALAVAILAVAGAIPAENLSACAWIGELGLDGKLRAVRGVLPAVLALQRAGITRVVVPRACAAEAALVPETDVRGADTLREVIEWLRGEGPAPERAEPGDETDPAVVPDLSDVLGQVTARRALEIAAAGSHHLSMSGPPGAGKTMLAERLPGILPRLNDDAALEVTAVHSVAGMLPEGAPLLRRPPFQAPHHTATVAALVGGGSGIARPGAISLAHHGVLLLDEAPEFPPAVLDALRQPLESGRVVLHRSGGAVSYPARFLLVIASNPCPCAAARARDCSCVSSVRRRYQQRLSGPLRDRIDLRLDVDPVSRADLTGVQPAAEPSVTVAQRVQSARDVGAARWQSLGYSINSQVAGSVLRRSPWRPGQQALRPLDRALELGLLSARGFDRALRVAWTIADLAGHCAPDAGDVAEALFFRSGRAPERAA